MQHLRLLTGAAVLALLLSPLAAPPVSAGTEVLETMRVSGGDAIRGNSGTPAVSGDGRTVGRVGDTMAGSTPSFVRVERSEMSVAPPASIASNATCTSSRPESRRMPTHRPSAWSMSATGGSSPANATTRASAADRPSSTSTDTSIVIPVSTSSARASASPKGAPNTTESSMARSTGIAESVPVSGPAVMTPHPPLRQPPGTRERRHTTPPSPFGRLRRVPTPRSSLTCAKP